MCVDGERVADALAVCMQTVVMELLITENVRRTREDNNMDTVRRNGRRARQIPSGPARHPSANPSRVEPTHPPPPVGQTHATDPKTGARSIGPYARRAATQRWRGHVRHVTVVVVIYDKI